MFRQYIQRSNSFTHVLFYELSYEGMSYLSLIMQCSRINALRHVLPQYSNIDFCIDFHCLFQLLRRRLNVIESSDIQYTLMQTDPTSYGSLF